MSDKYADKQKAKDKEEAANAKKEKKLQAKMDKIESKQVHSSPSSPSSLLLFPQ